MKNDFFPIMINYLVTLRIDLKRSQHCKLNLVQNLYRIKKIKKKLLSPILLQKGLKAYNTIQYKYVYIICKYHDLYANY